MILITGATGFLGREVTRQCIAAGFDVCTTARSRAVPPDLPRYTPSDLSDPGSLQPLFDGVTAVVHCAGSAHRRSAVGTSEFSANSSGTADLAGAAGRSGVRRFIYASSVAVYGIHSANPVSEDRACIPATDYGRSKFSGEESLAAVALETGMITTILRYGTMYGENDPGNLLRLIRAIDRRRFLWFGTGTNLKTLLHREDAARAAILALGRDQGAVERYNVTGSPVQMRMIVELIAAALGRRIPRWRVPGAAVALIGTILSSTRIRPARRVHNMVRTWLSDEVYDSRRFAERFGFEPRVSLEEGIAKEVAWYRATLEER